MYPVFLEFSIQAKKTQNKVIAIYVIETLLIDILEYVN